MASTATSIPITDVLSISYKQVLESPENVSGEPYLVLGFEYAVGGEMSVEIRRESRHPFGDCSLPHLKAFIQQLEPLPLDTVLDPGGVDQVRNHISDMVYALVTRYKDVERMKKLVVDVVLKMNDVLGEDNEEEERREEDDAENDCRRRMSLVNTYVYGSVIGGACREEEVCTVCMEGMKIGEEVICAPCFHRFHVACIQSWFKRSGFCPMCRFKIDDH